jgi:8-oxo-dGTP diphosphatase
MDLPADGITVAAGILRREGKILACRRRLGDAFGGRWELPGGKIRPGETPEIALARELAEELGISARIGARVEHVHHAYPDHPPVEIHFHEVTSFRGEPVNRSFETIRWMAPADLPALDWLEADRPLVERLATAHDPSLPSPAGDPR